MNRFNIKPPPWQQTPDWPCRWISCHEAGPAPFVVMYRCTFICFFPNMPRCLPPCADR